MEVISRKEAREKGLTQFFTGRPCSRGHLEPRSTSGGMCRGCERLRDKERLAYTSEVKKKRYATSALVRQSRKEQDRRNYANNKDKVLARKRKYYREKELPSRIARGILRNTFLAAKVEKHDHTSVILGYTPGQLKEHLDSLLADGMTWENYGEWHVDHIKPINAFIKEGITSPQLINALSNLQPLWAVDNLVKGASWHGD